MTPAQDAASFAWPPLTDGATRCTTRRGQLRCQGEYGHDNGHRYEASDAPDRHDLTEPQEG